MGEVGQNSSGPSLRHLDRSTLLSRDLSHAVRAVSERLESRAPGVPPHHARATSRGDSRYALLEREYTVCLEPLGGQDCEPFTVTAAVWFRWDALNTARTDTTEEDMLTTLMGRSDGNRVPTRRPWIRVDIELNARVHWGTTVVLPPRDALASWVEEVTGRLDDIEPLTPTEKVRENETGRLEVLAWQGQPRVDVVVLPDGRLRLQGASFAAFQILELPRILDHPEVPDPEPHEDLRNLFHRVRASLSAWMQALDHLKKG